MRWGDAATVVRERARTSACSWVERGRCSLQLIRFLSTPALLFDLSPLLNHISSLPICWYLSATERPLTISRSITTHPRPRLFNNEHLLTKLRGNLEHASGRVPLPNILAPITRILEHHTSRLLMNGGCCSDSSLTSRSYLKYGRRR